MTELLSPLKSVVFAVVYVSRWSDRYSKADWQDHHTLAGGWGPWVTPFVVSGHEVIGKVVEVGPKVNEFKVGDRVGVGAQVGACGECKACKRDLGTWGTV